MNLARSSAGNDSPVLLSGFTGSGKEIFANAIHNASARKDEPFLAVNCAAVPDGLLESILFGTTKGTFTGSIDKIGLFEQAKGGTLFLDEINSMSLNSQAKLLRVLEEKEIRRLGGYNDISVDVRIISSINTTPALALANNQLREDLFYRLSVTTIIIPPLNGRNDDIDLITEHFINKFNKVFNKNITGLSDEVHNFFMTYSWPGNVRQLKHVIESAVNSADSSSSRILMSDLPYYLFESSTTHVESFQYIPKQSEDLSAMAGAPTANPSYGAHDAPADVSDGSSVPTYSPSVSPENLYDTIRQQEKKNIIDALLSCNGNVTKAARILGMNRQQLVYRMRKYNINR